MNKLSRFMIVVAACVFATHSNATLLTLEGNDIRNTGIYSEQNFQITAPIDLVNGGNLSERQNLTEAGFTGDYMETWNTDAVFTLQAIEAPSFSLISLDVGSYYTTAGGLAAWTFRGFNGSTEVFTLVNNVYKGTLVLNWTNITSLTIQSSKGSAASSFDNIRLQAVPEPASIALMLMCLPLLAIRRVKRLLSR